MATWFLHNLGVQICKKKKKKYYNILDLENVLTMARIVYMS